MRNAYIQTLSALAEQDKDVWLVTGDLGFSVFEDFMKRFPGQYLNAGVSEQNMMGLAAGLALAGKRPFVYSISTFATMRPYEQIRDDICYQNLPVTIVGGGSAFSYSTLGGTHMPLEDLGIMRMLANMTVTCPGDPGEVEALMQAIYRRPGPAYMRIAKKGEPQVHPKGAAIELGKAAEARPGEDAVIFAMGRVLPAAVAAAEALGAKGYSVRVMSMHTLKPIDADAILKASNTRAIVTCEEHSLIGGLASAVAEVLARNGASVPLASIGVPDEFPSLVGSQEYFLKRYSIDAEGIEKAMLDLLA